uniref:DDE Tnp4 domain-containing protein n=1 Tax=Oryzias melastigma TaxID=30732 RepID=A0A3B3DA74_ORYME
MCLSIGAHDNMETTSQQQAINQGSPYTSVLASLWTLANKESYRSIADRFNVAKSTISTNLEHFCSIVNEHLSFHIAWPTANKLHDTISGFQDLGFPNTVSAVDGCHIHIPKPTCDNPNAHYNRKQSYSVLLIGFCHYQRKFCHVNVGHPGSWYDASFPPHCWTYIIGDSAFPLSKHVMKPSKENGHLTARQKHFNQKLNSARVVIEHTFGLLKTKFRRLKFLHHKHLHSVPSTVTTCCILHNICLDTDDTFEEYGEENISLGEDPAHPPNDGQNYRDCVCNTI